MDSSKTWKEQALRLKPFDGHLIPVRPNGYRIDGPVKDHNFTVEQILDYPNLRAIELRTSSALMCIDFDSEKAFVFAESKGFNWAENLTWIIQRDNQFSRMKVLFKRTLEQQKLGEFYLPVPEHDLEVFSRSTKPVTVLGHHRESGIYRWFGTGPETLIDCPNKVWNFVVGLKEEDDKKKTIKTTSISKSSSGSWKPIRPCPICNRQKDDDCSINVLGDFVQCHHGKTNHPPHLKMGETIHLSGEDWAFCGFGSNAIGEFSKFKIHKPTNLQLINKQLLERANVQTL
ncbi:hypothetical protein [Prochlorococcus marinus]|uniref:hypothetical protein n=1 Tax=Prochlorococcus marinus TaxID=1219 RepID=UPI0022B4A3DD|nr:hypothetical protein [Prochlorococcus marinus]